LISSFISLILSYLVGVVLAHCFSVFALLLILPALAWAIFWQRGTALWLLLIFCTLGWLNFQVRESWLLPGPTLLPLDKAVAITGFIDDEPQTKGNYSFFTLKVKNNLLAVVSKKADLQYGDQVGVLGVIGEIESLSNPGLLSFADYLKDQGIGYQLRATAVPRIIKRGGGSVLKKISLKVKNQLVQIPAKTLPEPYATLLSSIVFGSKAAKAPIEIKDTYKKAGVAHLLVASGMHLGILVGVCLFVVKMSRAPLWLGVLITSMINLLYALMTGFGPSILRAAIMAEIMLLGLLFEREKEIYTSLAISAFIILLYNPKFMFEVGFQLSFGATWSLVYVAPVLVDKLKNIMPKWLATLLSAALAPVLVSTPITLYHFSQTSIIGVVTNLLLLPWVGVIVVLGFVATVLGALFLPLGELINNANLVLLWLANFIVLTLAKLPWAQVFLAPPKLPFILGYYLALVSLVEIIRQGKLPKLSKFHLSLVACLFGSLLIWNIALADSFSGLTVTVLDVGQGDSILVETPSGKKMLIDAGEAEMGQRVVVPYLRRHGISRLDLVVMTHPHEDHVGGLPVVLENIKVDTVLEPGAVFKSLSYQRFKELIAKNKTKYQLARAGQVINFGQNCVAKVLHPELPLLTDNLNNVSVVIRLTYGKFSMMLTGDNEQEGEQQILTRVTSNLSPVTSIRSLIFKVGHHGSNTATAVDFLEAVSPQVAVISCGQHNKFHHPHGVTLKKLAERGIKVYRTDKNGAVVIRSNGSDFSIVPSKT